MRERLQSAGLLLTAALAACDQNHHIQVDGPRDVDAERCLTSAQNNISDDVAAILYKEPVMPDATTIDVMLRNTEYLDSFNLLYRYQGEIDYVDLDKGVARIEDIVSKEGEVHGDLLMYATRDCQEVVGFADCILIDPEVCNEINANNYFFQEGLPVNDMMKY